MRVEAVLEKLGPDEADDDAFYDCVEFLEDDNAAQRALYQRTLRRSEARVVSHMVGANR